MRRKVVLIMIVFTLIFVACDIGSRRIEIKEIPGVTDWIGYPHDLEVVIKCFIIRNAPMDLDELKRIVENYINDNLEQIVSTSKDIPTMYKCFFYRESKKLPWNWKANDGYLSEDHIEDHTDDMIVSVRWTTQNLSRKYTIMRRSSAEESYGEIIEEDEYDKVANKIVVYEHMDISSNIKVGSLVYAGKTILGTGSDKGIPSSENPPHTHIQVQVGKNYNLITNSDKK